MVTYLRLIIALSLFVSLSHGNFTKISRNNIFLSRRKRYLMFPMGSNIVITISFSKAFLRVQPRGWNTVYEMDFPFPLPLDTRLLKDKEGLHLERRDIYSQLEMGFAGSGLNGTACVTMMICEAKKFIPAKGKSLVRDLLLGVFQSSEEALHADQRDECDAETWIECPMPFLDFLLKSLSSEYT